MRNKIWKWLLLLLGGWLGIAQSWWIWAAPPEGKTISVVFSPSTPPYVLKDGSGIVVDIVREALAPYGYSIKPVFLPIGRGFLMFSQRKVDASSIIQETSGLKNAYYSDVFMQYHNYAFVLRAPGKHIQVSSLQDLGKLDVIAFQMANKYLGEAFGKAVAGNPRYQEFADQETQVLMLLKGRTDVAVMDRSIFEFYKRKLISEGKVPADIQVERVALFPPSQYRTAFVDPQVRDAFNSGLARMKANGRYAAIYDYYTLHYFEVPH